MCGLNLFFSVTLKCPQRVQNKGETKNIRKTFAHLDCFLPYWKPWKRARCLCLAQRLSCWRLYGNRIVTFSVPLPGSYILKYLLCNFILCSLERTFAYISSDNISQNSKWRLYKRNDSSSVEEEPDCLHVSANFKRCDSLERDLPASIVCF